MNNNVRTPSYQSDKKSQSMMKGKRSLGYE